MLPSSSGWTQRLKDVAPERGELVAEQDSLVCQGASITAGVLSPPPVALGGDAAQALSPSRVSREGLSLEKRKARPAYFLTNALSSSRICMSASTSDVIRELTRCLHLIREGQVSA